MNKQHELNALKEQRQQLSKQIERVEAELKRENDKWSEGHWSIDENGEAYYVSIEPLEDEPNFGFCFTTEANCQAYIEYQKAMVKLRDACRPYLTDAYSLAFVPCISSFDEADFNQFERGIPKFLWVSSAEKATQIASEHIEELKIIQNFKWEE
jgi:hypothetical protein